MRRAREEVLKALASPSACGERDHRRLAQHHLRAALRALRQTPGPEIDWSDVRPR